MLNLALSFSIASSIKSSSTVGLDYNYFWKHSLACASAGRQLGKSINYRKHDELFLPGLMQNIGMLAIESISPEVYQQLENKRCSHVLLQKKEIEVLNADHAAIGAWLLEKWNLPESITELVKASHDKTEPNVMQEYQIPANCTAMADFIADCICCDDEDKNYEQTAAIINDVMQLNDTQFLKVLDKTILEFRESADLFEINAGDTTILEALSESAKKVLQVAA